MSEIEVNRVSLQMNKVWILKDISFSAKDGMIIGLVGRNGSGKTMLMKCLSGYIKPDGGNIIIDGKELYKDIEFPPSMGLILETPSFVPYYSGMKNLQLLASLQKKIDKDRIRHCMELAGLQPDSKRPVKKYSLGMRQRLAIAQAIMEEPQLLILDEPLNSLDEEGVEDIRSLLLDMKSKGKTIILSSHNKEDIHLLCDIVIRLKHGEVCS